MYSSDIRSEGQTEWTRTHHNQVDQRNRIQTDAPEPHDTEHVDQDHSNGDAHDHCRPQLTAQENHGHQKDGTQGHTEVKDSVVNHGQVLFVEDVEHTGEGEKVLLQLVFASGIFTPHPATTAEQKLP